MNKNKTYFNFQKQFKTFYLKMKSRRKIILEKFNPTGYDNMSDRYYWQNKKGQLHRDGNQPAEIYGSGICYFYQNGYFIKSENRTPIKEQIKEIIETFNFKMVKETMKFLKWRWFDSYYPCTIKDLKRTAETLLLDSYNESIYENEDFIFCSTGGLYAEYNRDFGFKLKFVVEEVDSCAY